MSTARVARQLYNHTQPPKSYKNAYNSPSTSTSTSSSSSSSSPSTITTTTTHHRTYNNYLSPPTTKPSIQQTHHLTPIKQNKNRYNHITNSIQSISQSHSNPTYLSPPTHHQYNKNISSTPSYELKQTQDPDSDTLDDMESQSPVHPPFAQYPYRSPNYSHPRTSTPNMNTPHNIRLRKPIKSLQPSPNSRSNSAFSTSSSMSSSPKNGIYRRNFKRFQPKYGYGMGYNKLFKTGKSGQKKEDYTFKIILGVSLFLFAVSIYYFYGDLLTFSALKENHHAIIEFIDEYPRFSPMIFIIFECIVVGLTIPGATVLCMAAGINITKCNLFSDDSFNLIYDKNNNFFVCFVRFIFQSAICIILCMVWMWNGCFYLLFICTFYLC